MEFFSFGYVFIGIIVLCINLIAARLIYVDKTVKRKGLSETLLITAFALALAWLYVFYIFLSLLFIISMSMIYIGIKYGKEELINRTNKTKDYITNLYYDLKS